MHAENSIVIDMTRTVIWWEWLQQQVFGSLVGRCFVNPFTTVKWVELAIDAVSASGALFTSVQKLSTGSLVSSGIVTTAASEKLDLRP